MSSRAPEAGSEGVQPFQFECQRSGRCCSGGAGFVWIEEHEIAALAGELDLTPEAFTAQHLRMVADPRAKRMRLSLRERGGEGGACVLLEGTAECKVYPSRPAHCREFPFWPAILEDRAAFESARATCPGIRPLGPPATRAAAFAELAVLYGELDQALEKLQPSCVRSGLCCRFEDAGHELFATLLETDYTVALHPKAPAPEAPGRCPYHVAGVCTAREGRPLGCRTYYCDERTSAALEELHEQFLGRVREIEARNSYPGGYARFPSLLSMRGVGVIDRREEPSSRGSANKGQLS
ncbi:MAG: YkgJ family cysteine cluster protein [bacterium]|jgi:hypothetical protein